MMTDDHITKFHRIADDVQQIIFDNPEWTVYSLFPNDEHYHSKQNKSALLRLNCGEVLYPVAHGTSRGVWRWDVDDCSYAIKIGYGGNPGELTGNLREKVIYEMVMGTSVARYFNPTYAHYQPVVELPRGQDRWKIADFCLADYLDLTDHHPDYDSTNEDFQDVLASECPEIANVIYAADLCEFNLLTYPDYLVYDYGGFHV